MDFLPGQPCGISKGLLNILSLQIRVTQFPPLMAEVFLVR
jgi:hypothetical protein